MINFDPVKLTLEENQWLLDNLEKPIVIALRDNRSGVNQRVVKEVHDACSQLEAAKQADGTPWVGYERVKNAAKAYLTQSAKWAADKRLGRPRFPSMYSFDAKGRKHWSGPGSDSGQVRTYFGPNGERIPFALDLIDAYKEEWAPEWGKDEVAEAKDGIFINNEHARIECLVCGHTEKFRPDSRASQNAAKARISKHLRQAREKVEEHREAHTLVFGSANG